MPESTTPKPLSLGEIALEHVAGTLRREIEPGDPYGILSAAADICDLASENFHALLVQRNALQDALWKAERYTKAAAHDQNATEEQRQRARDALEAAKRARLGKVE